jgi:hypothetical protein
LYVEMRSILCTVMASDRQEARMMRYLFLHIIKKKFCALALFFKEGHIARLYLVYLFYMRGFENPPNILLI